MFSGLRKLPRLKKYAALPPVRPANIEMSTINLQNRLTDCVWTNNSVTADVLDCLVIPCCYSFTHSGRPIEIYNHRYTRVNLEHKCTRVKLVQPYRLSPSKSTKRNAIRMNANGDTSNATSHLQCNTLSWHAQRSSYCNVLPASRDTSNIRDVVLWCFQAECS